MSLLKSKRRLYRLLVACLVCWLLWMGRNTLVQSLTPTFAALSSSGPDPSQDADPAASTLPRPDALLPALPLNPRYFLKCRQGLGGVKQGLKNAGLRATDDMSEAQVVVACNHRVEAPKLASEEFATKLVSNIVGVVKFYCLGSQKAEQLACRKALASQVSGWRWSGRGGLTACSPRTQAGCAFDDLEIQPRQFDLPGECDALAATSEPVLIKPSLGQVGLAGCALPVPLTPPPCAARVWHRVQQSSAQGGGLRAGLQIPYRAGVRA
jgi:hypothetical protein